MDRQLRSKFRSRQRSLLLLVLLLGALLVPASGVSAAPAWAPADTAPIHPGVEVVTGPGACTSNFIFYDDKNVYIGQAAHCSTTGTATDFNGCTAPSLPLGTPVQVGGATEPGTLVYNSWVTMQEKGETDEAICTFNDLALVRLDPADAGKVNPSLPHWGGPTGLNITGSPVNQSMYSYGNSPLRFGLELLSPKIGFSQGDRGAGWSHTALLVTPGIPGDSGRAFLDHNGKALGVLSTVEIGLPGGVTNGIGDIARQLDYMRRNVPELSGVQLAHGTEPFNANQPPIGPLPLVQGLLEGLLKQLGL
ncbi:MAG TPA: serine protease [Actinomycetota bacterium]|nr:serine protease [Actinomycetota bacterium]